MIVCCSVSICCLRLRELFSEEEKANTVLEAIKGAPPHSSSRSVSSYCIQIDLSPKLTQQNKHSFCILRTKDTPFAVNTKGH